MKLSPRWVGVLADAGIEAVYRSTRGTNHTPDSQIMVYTRQHGFVVLTDDLDFGAILAATHGEKPSAIQIRADDVRPEIIGNPLVRAVRRMASELEEGSLLAIDPRCARMRLLPLRPTQAVSRRSRHAARGFAAAPVTTAACCSPGRTTTCNPPPPP